MGEQPGTRTPVTYEHCTHVIGGPFFHGTKWSLWVSATSWFPDTRPTTRRAGLEPPLLQRAAARAGGVGSRAGDGAVRQHRTGTHLPRGAARAVRGRPQPDRQAVPGQPDPVLPGPATRCASWASWTSGEGHDADARKGMLDNLARLREQGLDIIED